MNEKEIVLRAERKEEYRQVEALVHESFGDEYATPAAAAARG